MGLGVYVGELLVQGQQGYPGPWSWHYNMMGGGWGIFMFIFMLLFWGLIIAGIIILVRFIFPALGSKGASDTKTAEDAIEILKRRYARGEIQKTEFEEKKKDLLS